MYHNIKVNVVGPMKSGKSQVVRIIEEATAGMGIVVTEQNVQDEPTAESRSAPAAEAGREPQAGGGSAPSPCSASGVSDQHVSPVNGYLRLLENQKSLHEVRIVDGISYSTPVNLTWFGRLLCRLCLAN